MKVTPIFFPVPGSSRDAMRCAIQRQSADLPAPVLPPMKCTPGRNPPLVTLSNSGIVLGTGSAAFWYALR